MAIPPLPSSAASAASAAAAGSRAAEKKPSFAPPKINSFSLPPPPLNVPNGIMLPDVPVAVPAFAVVEPKREPKVEQGGNSMGILDLFGAIFTQALLTFYAY